MTKTNPDKIGTDKTEEWEERFDEFFATQEMINSTEVAELKDYILREKQASHKEGYRQGTISERENIIMEVRSKMYAHPNMTLKDVDEILKGIEKLDS